MTRLFVVADEESVEHATRFARRCSSGLNLFALADRDGSIRGAVREARPDIAILVGIDDSERAARHVREVSDEAPSAVVLVLAEEAQTDLIDEVCHAAATVCVTVASKQHDADGVAAEPNGTPAAPHVNGNGNGHGNGHGAAAAVSPPRDQVAAQEVARDHETTAWRLTPREVDVLSAAAEGLSNAQIGRRLWVTEQTVKFHLSNIYRKMGVSNRTEAMRRAISRGLVSMPRSVREPASGRTPLMAP
jgi:DNA-binding NarL/FixJ family response regulator